VDSRGPLLFQIHLAESDSSTFAGRGFYNRSKRGCSADVGPARSNSSINTGWVVYLAMHLAITALLAPMRDETDVLSVRLRLAFEDRDWQQARELIEKMKGGEDNGVFAHGFRPIPVGCHLILLARLQGEEPEGNLTSADARKQLSRKVLKSPGDADLLSKLAVVDALLGKKQEASTEVKRAAEMLPISRDAVNGPEIMKNLVVVYAWTGELELSFKVLVPLTKMPFGIDYGDLKLSPLWDPLRKDPHFAKLLAPKDRMD
jgi:hypothetical protein